MLVVVGCRVSPRLQRNTGKREKTEIRRKMSSKNEGKNMDPSHLAGCGYQDEEYYETCLSFEELFEGHLKIVTSQGQCEAGDGDHQRRLSPLIKVKLNPRIVN